MENAEGQPRTASTVMQVKPMLYVRVYSSHKKNVKLWPIHFQNISTYYTPESIYAAMPSSESPTLNLRGMCASSGIVCSRTGSRGGAFGLPIQSGLASCRPEVRIRLQYITEITIILVLHEYNKTWQ
eukprot:scaffold128928_cov17-Prasinocladus_malaysianus.AAC.2